MKGCLALSRKFPGLGEGRSKDIYIEPNVKDTAVLLAFYNPARFKRLLKNILYLIEIFKRNKIPYFVAECVFDGKAPQIPEATITLRSNSYMFYKEQLINLLEKKVPKQYTKLVMLDADILFDAPDWVDQISYALDKVDIVHPYATACWLSPDNKRIQSKSQSYGHAIVHKLPMNGKTVHNYHPGFVWAFRRSTFQALGGFYPKCIIGSGDMVFVMNFFDGGIPESYITDVLRSRFMIDDWPAYNKRFKEIAPKVGYLNMKALHLFHGLTISRQYDTRHKMVRDKLVKPWKEMITVNADGLTEFKDPSLHHYLLPYFKGRNEDIPLRQALNTTRRVRRQPRPAEAQVPLPEKLNQGGEPTVT